MIRDILNYLGEKIGELELPDDTSEDIWQEKLSKYTLPPQNTVIKEVSPRQLRSALVLSGISESSVLSAIAQLPSLDKELAGIAWEYSTTFVREGGVVDMLGAFMGLSSQQLDDLWNLAAGL